MPFYRTLNELTLLNNWLKKLPLTALVRRRLRRPVDVVAEHPRLSSEQQGNDDPGTECAVRR